MADQSFEENVLRMRLQYLRNEFSELLCRKNEMICHEENLLNIRYLNLFGQKQYDVYCLKLDIAMLKRRKEYLDQFISNNRIPDLKVIDEELAKDFGKYQKKLEEESLKIAVAREHVANNPLEAEQIKRATELYRAIIPHIHPRIYKETCDRCVDFLAKTNSAYVMLELNVLEEIAGMTSQIEKEDHFADYKEFRSFVDTIEKIVANLKLKLDQMNLEFPFNVREDVDNQEWIESECARLDNEAQMLETEKRKLSDEVILCQLWKPDSLN